MAACQNKAPFARLFQINRITKYGRSALRQIIAGTPSLAGSVISEAATVEGVKELTLADFNGLAERYAAQLMTNLTEADYTTMINGDAHAAATKMIGDVCIKIYQKADQSIIKTHPELSDYAAASNCSDPGAMNLPKAVISD